jgi:FixJ family two-component response regulator
MSEPTRADPIVYVVDDDSGVRVGLKRLLAAHGLRAECHASADDFLSAAPDADIGCIVLDVRMPGTDGLALQQRLADEEDLYPVIFLSGSSNVRDGVLAMRSGALDFLEKPVDERELMCAVGRALALHRDRRRRQAHRLEVEARQQSLTPREGEVMRLVVAGLRNHDIALQLGIRESTVKIHRGRVMRKMDAASLPDLVRIVELGLGDVDAGMRGALARRGVARA